jgi:nucleoside-diphosphate-sugar epimerase
MSDWVILGCGYTGTRLARALLADGHRVRACARNLQRLEPLAALGAELHHVDATKLRAFGPALYGTRSPIVVYSIPPVPQMPSGEPLRRACDAAMAVGADRFIYLSSTAVYGETEYGVTVDEESPIATGDPDAQARIAEEGAVETGRLAGLSTVILRLAAIYGPGRGVRERLRAGTYKLTDDGIHFFSRVHVDDLVGVIRAAGERAPSGSVYCVADDRPSTQREYAEWLAARMGVPVPPSVPSMEVGKPRRAVRNRKVSNAKLKRELGYAFRYPSFVEGELAIEAEAGELPVAATPPPTAAPPPPPSEEPPPAPTPPPTPASASTTAELDAVARVEHAASVLRRAAAAAAPTLDAAQRELLAIASTALAADRAPAAVAALVAWHRIDEARARLEDVAPSRPAIAAAVADARARGRLTAEELALLESLTHENK